MMSFETAERGVDIALESPVGHINIEFQGGEPLINFPVIKHIVEYANEKAKEILKNPRPAGSWRPLKCIFSGKKELRVKIAPRRKIFAEIRPKQAAAIRVVSARGNLRLT